MLTLGFMTLNLNNEQGYFTEIARRANHHDIICYRFIPSKMNPKTEMIEGEIFDHELNKWLKSQFPLPEILYDRCFYGEDFHSRQCKAIVNWLKTNNRVQFLGFGLPNKMDLYRTLSHSKLSPYLPKTITIQSPEMVHSLLEGMERIILKPINGAQGNGIYLIEKKNNQYLVKTDKKEKQVSRNFTDEKSLLPWLQRLLNHKEFILQPYLPLTNGNNQPFDIRSLLQKDKDGKWSIIGKGIRQGEQGGIVSNVSLGATITTFENWLETIVPAKQSFMKEEIKDILHRLPSILEGHYPPLFELGVDIGVAKDDSIWILDVNSKPGRKVLFSCYPEKKEALYENPLLYAKTLKERSHPFHEKTLSD